MLLNNRKNRRQEPSMASATLNLMMLEFAPEWEAAKANLSRLDAIMERIFSLPSCGYPGASQGGAAEEGSMAAAGFMPDIIVLPEFFSTGFSMNPCVAEYQDLSPSLGWMLRTAALYDCAVAGSIPVIGPDGRRFNRFFFVTPEGVLGQYDKRHLFFGGEDASYTHGTDRVILEYKGWRILLGTCFDLRFPVWMRNDGNDPYDLYINVANWPAARRKAAEVLAAARAIENVCYVAFCNRAGHDPLLAYDGGSSVINHRGRVRSVSSRVMDTDVVYAVLDMAEMLRFRASFPILGLVDRHNLL